MRGEDGVSIEGVTRVPVLRRLRPSRRPGVWCSPAPCSWRSAPWRPWPSSAARRSRPAKSEWSCRTGMSSKGHSPSGTVCTPSITVCARACSSLAACSTPSVRGLLYRARPVATRQSAAACSPALLLHRDANWDLKDIQQHLVRTQRQQTSNNKKFVSDIARIDMTIEDLMKQVPNTPSTFHASHPEHGCPAQRIVFPYPYITLPARSTALCRHAAPRVPADYTSP